jgi:hypothetical protein
MAFFRFFETRPQWRQVAVYHSVGIANDARALNDGPGRPSVLHSCHPGMRVLLRREPTRDNPSAVSVHLFAGGQIGHLPAEVAEWIAPLLDSGKTVFNAEIWSLDKIESEPGPEVHACQLLLTQHELAPIKCFSLTPWLPELKYALRAGR